MSNKVLVPIIKPSQKSTKLGKKVASAITAGGNPLRIGAKLASLIKRGGRR